MVDADRLTGWVKPREIWQINFCYLNFANRKKLCKNSVFYENMNTFAFILFSRFCSFPFRKCIPLPSLSDIHILRDSVPNLNISTRSVTVDTFNRLKRIFFLPEEVGGGLATGWFVTVANFAPHFFGRKFLRESSWRKIFWCRDVCRCHVRANWEDF